MIRNAIVANILLAAVLSACTVNDLNLPPAPSAQRPPTVTSFSPAEAHADTAITVRGSGFGDDPLKLKVQLGNGPTVQADTVSSDGTSLTVIVPKGSTSGPVNVTTSAGVGTSESLFHYLGAGDLNIGAVTSAVDLRIRLCDAFGLQGGNYLASPCDDAGLFVFDLAHVPSRLSDDDQISLVAASLDGHWISYVTESDWQDAACNDGPASCLISQDALFNDRTCLCLPQGETFVGGDLAWDAAGQRVLLRNGQHLSIIDWSNASSPMLTSVTPDFLTASQEAHIVWLDATHVAVGQGTTVHRLEASSLSESDPPTTVAVGTFSDDLTVPPVLHGLRAEGQTLAVVSDRFVAVYDATVWPPVQRQQLTPTDNPLTGVAELTADGKYLAAVEQENGGGRSRVLVYDLSSTQTLPLQSVLVEHAVNVHLSSNGTFMVAGVGGVTEIAPDTGNVLGMLTFAGGYRSMILHAPEAKELSASVEVLSTALDVVRRFNSDSLTELTERPPPQNRDGMSRSAQAVAPDGLTTYSISTQSLQVFDDNSGGSAQLDFYPDWLTVGADGRSVVVYASASRGDPMNPSVPVPPSWTVLDATNTAAWNSTPPVRQEEPNTSILVAFADATRVYVFTTNDVRVYDLKAALAGRSVQVSASPVMLPSAAHYVLPSPAGFLLDLAGRDDSNPGDELELLSTDSLQLTKCGALPPTSGDFDWQLSPEGRHLWLSLATSVNTSLQSYRLDQTTCKLGSLEWDVRLPGDVWQLQVAPTGERLFALDPYQERLFVVE